MLVDVLGGIFDQYDPFVPVFNLDSSHFTWVLAIQAVVTSEMIMVELVSLQDRCIGVLQSTHDLFAATNQPLGLSMCCITYGG